MRRIYGWRHRLDRLASEKGVRHSDLSATVGSLAATGLGLALLLWLGLARPHEVAGWGWVAALALVIVGTLWGAPVFSGRFLAMIAVVGFLLTGVGLARVGMERISAERRSDARATATLIAYRLQDIGAPGDAAERLCESAGGDLAGPTCTRVTEREGSLRGLAVTRAEAELAVAEQEIAAATTDEGRAAAKDAVTRARAAISTAKVDEVEVAEAIREGASGIVDDLVGGDAARVPLAFGVLGWILVGVAAFAVLRWAAVRNATRGLGPVTLEEPDVEDRMWSACRERFRTYLLQNVPEPGAVPNANAVAEVANLAGALAPQTRGGAGAVAAAIEALTRTVVVPRGYSVQVGFIRRAAVSRDQRGRDGKSGPGAASAPEGLVVRVRKTRTRVLLAQREFAFGEQTDGARDAVVRRTAYWAAAVILDESRSVPAWGRWSPSTASALAAYCDAATTGKQRLEQLQEAERIAPTSGVVLLTLANETSSQGSRAEVVGLTLTATALHPRYLDARYRLASESSMLARDLDNAVANGHHVDLSVVRRAAERYVATDRALSALVNALPDASAVVTTGHQQVLTEFGVKMRRRARRQLSRSGMLLNALRASERDFWCATLRHGQIRRDRIEQLDSADLVAWAWLRDHWQVEAGKSTAAAAAIRRPGQLLGRTTERRIKRVRNAYRRSVVRAERRLVRRAEQPHVCWQLPYNLACHFSREGAWDAAVRMLERARRGRGSFQLSREWLCNDPDLVPLKDELKAQGATWFEDFATRCRPDSKGIKHAEPSFPSLVRKPIPVQPRRRAKARHESRS